MSERVGPPVRPAERRPAGVRARRRARTLDVIDDEMRRIVDECYEEACRKLRDHRGQLDALAEALLANETLEEADAYRIAGITRLTKDDAARTSTRRSVGRRRLGANRLRVRAIR